MKEEENDKAARALQVADILGGKLWFHSISCRQSKSLPIEVPSRRQAISSAIPVGR